MSFLYFSLHFKFIKMSLTEKKYLEKYQKQNLHRNNLMASFITT